MILHEPDNPALFEQVKNRNIVRQYETLMDSIAIGIPKGSSSFDKYLLWTLNHVAVANLHNLGGRFREESVSVGAHRPPPPQMVNSMMDRFIATIQQNWFTWTPIDLAAYGLWQLNWIHPFLDGNGRTARAVCYFLFCVRIGIVLPGSVILPERIRRTKVDYLTMLRVADKSFNQGALDLRPMSSYLNRLIAEQLSGSTTPSLPPPPNVRTENIGAQENS